MREHKTLLFAAALTLSSALFITTPDEALARSVQLSIGTQGSQLAYDKTELLVHAGDQVAITFTNRADQGSGLQHNWVLIRPGSEESVSAGAIQAGYGKGFVPAMPEVIVSSRLLDAGQSQTLHFKAPAQPGNYPYICTFPGHSQSLRGVLKVVK